MSVRSDSRLLRLQFSSWPLRPGSDATILFGHLDDEIRNVGWSQWPRPGVRDALPSYFKGINFRCHANNVSGVTIVAICAKTFLPNLLALAASWRRWLSVNRNRRSPICSRRTRFSSTRYSMTCCCRGFSQPATDTTGNENGSKPDRIGAAYDAHQPILPLATNRVFGITRSDVWRFSARQREAIQDEQLVFEQNGLNDNGANAARTRNANKRAEPRSL